MNVDFDNEEIKELILLHKCEGRMYKKLKSNARFFDDMDSVFTIFRVVENVEGLKRYRRLNYEKLKGDREGESSVRIGYKSKYRLIFVEKEEGISVKLIEVSEHYGDK